MNSFQAHTSNPSRPFAMAFDDSDEAPATIRDPGVPEGCEPDFRKTLTKFDLFGLANANEPGSATVARLSIAADPVVLPFADPWIVRWANRLSERALAVTFEIGAALARLTKRA